MSTDDITRIMDKLDNLGDRMARVETTVGALDEKADRYNGLKDRTMSMEGAVAEIKSNCTRIQGEKAAKRAPWVSLLPMILSGVVLILAGVIVDLMFKR